MLPVEAIFHVHFLFFEQVSIIMTSPSFPLSIGDRQYISLFISTHYMKFSI